MTEDFDEFSSQIVSLIKTKNLNTDIIEILSQYTNQIIEQGILNNPNSKKTDKFLNETVPNVGSILLSSLEMTPAQLQLSHILIDNLNTLALWGMLNSKENLVNNLLCLTNSNASYYVQNAISHPNIFVEKVHYFLSSSLFNQLNDKMAEPKNFQVSMLFSIYAFIFQYCTSCDHSDEVVSSSLRSQIQRFLNAFENSMDNKTFSMHQPSTLVIIIESLHKAYSTFDMLDTLPVFMKFLSLSSKSENCEEKLSALGVLSSYASSDSEQVAEYFDEWKKETDVVSSLIRMDLSLEALKVSQDLIVKAIRDDELFDFLTKAKGWFVVQRHFTFHLVAQIMVERFEIDTINDLVISKLPRDSVDIEFLCALLIDVFKYNKEELFAGIDDIIDLIFKVGSDDLPKLSPIMFHFFKELNEIDHDPSIIFYRVRILTSYVRILKADDFADRICFFFADQFEKLFQVSLQQQSFEEIQAIFEETLTKAKDYYVSIDNVSEAMIRLIYILVLFRNIDSIAGEPYHIRMKEPTNYEYFDYALLALTSCKDPIVADLAIDLFSQFFSHTTFLSESITILYNFCACYLQDGIDQMSKCRVLELIYKVLVDLEGDYELIDFENKRRNHRNDKKGNNLFKVVNGQTTIELYAKPNSTAGQLIDRIAMRLHRTEETIKVTDSKEKEIDPTRLASSLSQPLNVTCQQSDDPQVNYCSASFTLWNNGFTKTLLNILDDSSSQPELVYITKKLLSFLPSDQTIMNLSINIFMQMINDAERDEKLSYLLHCVNHFSCNTMKVIANKIDIIWKKFQSEQNWIPAIFEFFFNLMDADTTLSDYQMFIAGRIFRSLFLHHKKSYKILTDLFSKKLAIFVNIRDEYIIEKIITSCDDEEWPYLKEIIKSFKIKSPTYQACFNILSTSQFPNKFVLKILGSNILGSSFSREEIHHVLEIILQHDNYNDDEFTDVLNFINDANIIAVHDYYINHPENFDKIINFALRKGFFDAKSPVDRFILYPEPTLSQPTVNKLYHLFDQIFDVWNYISSDHIQSQFGVGIKDVGSMSYMNSLFQVFNRIPVFLNEIFASSDDNLRSFQWVLASLKKSNRDFIDPSKFISEWNGWIKEQDDEQLEITQFFHCVMKNCPKSAQSLFTGERLIKYTGGNGFEKEVSEPFFSLSFKAKGFNNLAQSMYSTTEPEIVSYVDENGNETLVTRSEKITLCPKILVIQLDRFEHDQQSQMNVKNNQRFEFPEHLNISPVLHDEKDTFYSLNSIICHSEDYCALLHENKDYQKAAAPYYKVNGNEDKWISIQNQTITELPNGYKDRAFGSACILFYVLENCDSAPSEVKIGEDLCNTIQKENEAFGLIQTIFSVDFVKTLQYLNAKDPCLPYFFNVLMHGSSEFKDSINQITQYIYHSDVLNYIEKNFSNFLEIFMHPEVPDDLMNPFVSYLCKAMEGGDADKVIEKVFDALSHETIAECAIMPLLLFVYSNLKAKSHPCFLTYFIDKLVKVIGNCIENKISKNVKIDNALLPLTELIKSGMPNINIRDMVSFKIIEDNYQFITDHISNIKSLDDFVEQAVKYNLINAPS